MSRVLDCKGILAPSVMYFKDHHVLGIHHSLGKGVPISHSVCMNSEMLESPSYAEKKLPVRLKKSYSPVKPRPSELLASESPCLESSFSKSYYSKSYLEPPSSESLSSESPFSAQEPYIFPSTSPSGG